MFSTYLNFISIVKFKHGIDSKNPLSYTHIDIAGSSGKFPGNVKNFYKNLRIDFACSFYLKGIPTAAPLSSFVHKFILPKL
jgi:hypothetical protein